MTARRSAERSRPPRRAALLALLAFAVAGCGMLRGGDERAVAEVAPAGRVSRLAGAAPAGAGGRMFVKRASLRLVSDDVARAAARAAEIAEDAGGYVESTDTSEDRSRVGLRVPADRLEATLDRLAELGTVRHRSVSASDVTETVLDMEARLENHVALRDRLRALLARADRVEDLLAIETELGRIQAEIDSLESRLEHLREQVALAAVQLVVERRRVLGPLGIVGKGAWWLLRKLFVLD